MFLYGNTISYLFINEYSSLCVHFIRSLNLALSSQVQVPVVHCPGPDTPGQCCCVLPRRCSRGVTSPELFQHDNALHCSTCSYAQVCHNLNQLIVVTLSRAPLRDAVVTCHVSRPGWVTILTTGHGAEVMMMIHKYALLSGCLRHFVVS